MKCQGVRNVLRRGFRTGLLTAVAGVSALTLLAGCQKSMTEEGLNSGMSAGIVNGIDATGQEAFSRHVVGLANKSYSGGYSIFCSGTIISQQLLVTAAHCVEAFGSEVYAVFGLNEKSPNLEVRRITRHERHERYVSWFPSDAKDVHDIGLAQFGGGLPSGYYPVAILQDDSILQPGKEVVMAGYGVTNGSYQTGSGTLRYTTVRVKELYGESELKTDESMSGTCNGDSGGPGFVEYGGRYYLWGATSRGDARCVSHGIYTKATSFRAWISQRISLWSQSTPPFDPIEYPQMF